tara:strand:+ start:7509 stop:7748 length:240 start_codon:yes stop_codon:yes gene_type:complete
MNDEPSVSNTVAQLIEWKFVIRVFCIQCGHPGEVDLEKIAVTSKRGDQVTVADIRRRLKCAECASKNMSITVDSNDWID